MDTKPESSFPSRFRLLRSSDFRRAYRRGIRMPGRYFRAFCYAREKGIGPRVGLTVPRAVGNAVVRNRIKRRMREAVRRHIRVLDSKWDVVFNPMAVVRDVPFQELEKEVRRVFERCNAS